MPVSGCIRFLGRSLPDGWERGETVNKIPFYINHKLEITQWDHPILERAFDTMPSLNFVKYAAYRTAVKVRLLQKTVNVDLIELKTIEHVFASREKKEKTNEVTVYENAGVVDAEELRSILEEIVRVTKMARPSVLSQHLDAAVDLLLNLLLDLFDVKRAGCIRLLSVKVALGVLCTGRLAHKYRFLFNQIATVDDYRPLTTSPLPDPPSTTRKAATTLFLDLMRIPLLLHEGDAFGGAFVAPAVESCFAKVLDGRDALTLEVFMDWMKQEPQTFVWMPTLHRLTAAEDVEHDVKCGGCKAYPITGFRYKCLKCFNLDFCQNCFFIGRSTKRHKSSHPMQEYCDTTSPMAETKALAQTIKNNLTKGYKRKAPKLRYLPISSMGMFFDKRAPRVESQPWEDENIINGGSDPFDDGRFRGDGIRSGAPIPRPDFDAVAEDEEDEGAENGENSYQSALPQTRHDYAVPSGGDVWNAKQKREMESIIVRLEIENRRLMSEIDAMRDFADESTASRFKSLASLDGAASDDRRGDAEASFLPLRDATNVIVASVRDRAFEKRVKKEKMEAKLEVLESHNRQLETQVSRLRKLFQQTLKGNSSPEPPPPPPLQEQLIRLPPPPANFSATLSPNFPECLAPSLPTASPSIAFDARLASPAVDAPAESTRISEMDKLGASVMSPLSCAFVGETPVRVVDETNHEFTSRTVNPSEISKSCFSLPPAEGSRVSEEAAEMQAILYGYLASVPTGTDTPDIHSAPTKSSRQRNLLSAAQRFGDVMGGFVEKMAPRNETPGVNGTPSDDGQTNDEDAIASLSGSTLVSSDTLPSTSAISSTPRSTSRLPSSYSSSFIARSSSGFSEDRCLESPDAVRADSREGDVGFKQSLFSVNGISRLSLDDSIPHANTFDESFD